MQSSAGSPALVTRLQPGDGRRTLILCPPGGGNALKYVPLIDALPDELTIHGLRLPGSDGRDEPRRSIRTLSELLIPEILRHQPNGPYRLFGWSTGGLLAYDLATQLDRAGHPVDLIALADTVFPGRQDDVIEPRGAKYQRLMSEEGVGGVGREFVQSVGYRVRPLAARADRLRAARRNRAPKPSSIETTMFEAAHEAATSYRPPPYAGTVVAYRASQTDAELTVEPWRTVAADLRTVELDGAHTGDDSIMDRRRVDKLAIDLRGRLQA